MCIRMIMPTFAKPVALMHVSFQLSFLHRVQCFTASIHDSVPAITIMMAVRDR